MKTLLAILAVVFATPTFAVDSFQGLIFGKATVADALAVGEDCIKSLSKSPGMMVCKPKSRVLDASATYSFAFWKGKLVSVSLEQTPGNYYRMREALELKYGNDHVYREHQSYDELTWSNSIVLTRWFNGLRWHEHVTVYYENSALMTKVRAEMEAEADARTREQARRDAEKL